MQRRWGRGEETPSFSPHPTCACLWWARQSGERIEKSGGVGALGFGAKKGRSGILEPVDKGQAQSWCSQFTHHPGALFFFFLWLCHMAYRILVP